MALERGQRGGIFKILFFGMRIPKLKLFGPCSAEAGGGERGFLGGKGKGWKKEEERMGKGRKRMEKEWENNGKRMGKVWKMMGK